MEIFEEDKIGYKKTKFGWIPNDWDIITINQISDYKKSNFNDGDWIESKHIVDDGVRLIQTGNIGIGEFKEKDKKKYISENSFFELKCSEIFEEDILICRLADPSGRACIVPKLLNERVITSVDVSIFRPNITIAARNYLVQFFSTEIWFNEVKKKSAGSTRSRISRSELGKIKFYLPKLTEQQKIASILLDWDEIINLKKNQLQSNILLRKGLEQNLLNGNIRFKEFIKSEEKVKSKIGTIPKEWNLRQISEIVDRVKKPLSPSLEKRYKQIGIRSHCKGIFYKEEITGESLGNKSVFWIQPDCFIVNIVFAWEHAIAKTTDKEVGMIASHRFPMYKPKEFLDLDFLLYFFKTAMGKHLLGLASPGGAGRNKTLGQNEFIKLKIPVPSLKEQKKIVSVLNDADKEINLLKLEIQTLEKQKKGLMQQLLTGKIRVKTD